MLIETEGQPIQEAVLTRDIQPHCRHRFVFKLTAPVVEAGVVILRGPLKIGDQRLVGQANAVSVRRVSTAERLPPYGVGWLNSELPWKGFKWRIGAVGVGRRRTRRATRSA